VKIGVSDDILLIKKFGIRASGGKQLFVWPQEPCRVKQRFIKHIGSNLGSLAGIYALNSLTKKT
jgi:hypothetical protein